MSETFMEWVEGKFTAGNLLNLLVILVSAIWLVAFLRSDVDQTQRTQKMHLESYQQFRFQEVPETYVRQDVAAERYKALMQKLEAIEAKIDD